MRFGHGTPLSLRDLSSPAHWALGVLITGPAGNSPEGPFALQCSMNSTKGPQLFPFSEVVLGFCSHFPRQGYAFHKQRRGPTQTPALRHRALAQSRCSFNKWVNSWVLVSLTQELRLKKNEFRPLWFPGAIQEYMKIISSILLLACVGTTCHTVSYLADRS